MKYAVISDIHGNMDALDAVLSDAEKQSADIFLFAGDYCLSMPFPEQAVQRICLLYTSGNTINNWMLVYGGQDFSLWGIVEGAIARLIH